MKAINFIGARNFPLLCHPKEILFNAGGGSNVAEPIYVMILCQNFAHPTAYLFVAGTGLKATFFLNKQFVSNLWLFL
jgi:hypothetical protein